ncbi:MAG: hypothetical protein EOP04_25520, partial [Proteobacteria bacterium]
MAAGKAEKVACLVDLLPNTAPRDRDKLLEFIETSRTEIQDTHGLIWNELRELVAHHREHQEQDWALQEDVLIRIDNLYKAYTPTIASIKHRSLFEHEWELRPEDLSGKKWSKNERTEYLNGVRISAFKEIYMEEGIDGILKLAASLKTAGALARAGANADLHAHEIQQIIHLLAAQEKSNLWHFASRYILFKFLDLGSAWVKNTLKILERSIWIADARANFYLSLPFSRETWSLIEEERKEDQEQYWRTVNPHFHFDDNYDRLYAVEKLMQMRRFITLIDNIPYEAENLPSATLISILAGANDNPVDAGTPLSSNDVSKVFS